MWKDMGVDDYNRRMNEEKPRQRLLVVGAGDIGQRLLAQLAAAGDERFELVALVRRAEAAEPLRALGARVLVADLDDPASLAPLAGIADGVVHLAPPPAEGERDTRTSHLLQALGAGHAPLTADDSMVAQGLFDAGEAGLAAPSRRLRSLVYMSTSGVYGDCGGEWVDEDRPVAPQSARARRRVDAERQVLAWGERESVAVTVLRVPGIYAEDRLPLARLRAGTPVLRSEDDVFTNHIHADDLATIVRAAIERPGQGVLNACDESQIRMGDWFDAVADAFDLPRPPRIARAEAAGCIPAPLLSFMAESRRLHNDRMKARLGVVLRYPVVQAGLAQAKARAKERACGATLAGTGGAG
jgi:nucleoside-diphosphate-sugar epimerase